MTIPPGRPESDEFASSFADYVGRVPEADPVQAMRLQIDETAALLGRVVESAANARYAAGKWSIKEVVGHMADTERIMAYRALRIARGDQTPLAGFDENAYVPVAHFDRRTLKDLVAELRDVRHASVRLFEYLDTAAWKRRGTASEKPISVRALAFIIPGHERHHVDVLRTRYGLSG
jgi:hypothetical protein